MTGKLKLVDIGATWRANIWLFGPSDFMVHMTSAGQGLTMFSMTEIHDASLQQLQAWWLDPSATPGEFEDDDALDEIAFGLTRHQPAGIEFLKRFLNDETHRHRAALYFLSMPELMDDTIRAALQKGLNGSNVRTRHIALWGFILAKEFSLTDSQLSMCLNSADERTAALAMVYQGRANLDQRFDLLRGALASSNRRDREYACDEIGDFRISELVEEMNALLNDPDEDVVAAAKCNLEFFD